MMDRLRNPVRILCDNRTSEAAFCQNVKDDAYKAARARWVQDFTGMRDIEFSLYEYAIEQAKKQRWKTPKGTNYPQRFAILAVYELRHPKKFSQRTPEKRNPENDRKPSQRKRAEFLGIEYKTFMNYWRGRYEYIYGKLESDIHDSFSMIWRNQVDIDKIY